MDKTGHISSFAASSSEDIIAELDIADLTADPLVHPVSAGGSWPFRFGGFCARFSFRILGVGSIIFLLALLANVPVLQLVAFGYLLDAGGRLARGQKFGTLISGVEKATQLGGVLLGTWLLLLPARFVYGFSLDAFIISPDSRQTMTLGIVFWIVLSGSLLHIFAAIICGGKLRYFFWPLIAPFSLAIWLVRRSSITRKLLSLGIGWISPKLVADICNAQPITDWFLPAIFLRRLFTENMFLICKESISQFLKELELPRYFMFGLKGLIGTLAWLALPTLMLAGSTNDNQGVAGLSLLLGIIISVPVFAMLPFVQAHFACDGKLRRFFEPIKVVKNAGRAPIAHVLSLLLILVLALPLFLLKIEEVPSEFLWSLSLLFIAFGWPSHIIAGWAFGRGQRKEKPVRWWLRYPIQFLAAPVAFSFAVIFYLTRYISWNGTLSLLENHVFLLPAPFWLS